MRERESEATGARVPPSSPARHTHACWPAHIHTSCFPHFESGRTIAVGRRQKYIYPREHGGPLHDVLLIFFAVGSHFTKLLFAVSDCWWLLWVGDSKWRESVRLSVGDWMYS